MDRHIKVAHLSQEELDYLRNIEKYLKVTLVAYEQEEVEEQWRTQS
jgi:hypothetical protein